MVRLTRVRNYGAVVFGVEDPVVVIVRIANIPDPIEFRRIVPFSAVVELKRSPPWVDATREPA